MTKEDLLSHVGSCRSKTQRTINDTCIWCSVALDSLEQSLRDKSVLTRSRFSVPSAKRKKTVAREPEAVEAIVREAIDGHLYSSLLVYLVAQLEASLGEVMREVLVFDPRRLKCKVQGISRNNTVDVASVIDSQSRDELLQTIVDSELISVSYANPKAQLSYMEKVLGITLDGTIKAE